MSKAVQEKVNELFESTKNLKTFEEMQPYCDDFNSWIMENTTYSQKSLGTVLSRAGLYKKFKSLKLEQEVNAVPVPKFDKDGNQVATELKHYVLTQCGLTKNDWTDRNTTTRATDRLSNGNEIDPNQYLEVVGKLLSSDDPHELAVGLIASTGRRPHEILARAKFTPIEGEDYQVMFEGQGKKRGEKPVFKIATLYPAEYIIKIHTQLLKEPSTKALLKEVKAEFPKDTVAQNRRIDSRRNGSVNRVVRAYFGDKDDSTPVLAIRHGEEQDNCKALRAAYAALATERDCPKSVGEKMLHAARLLGHYVGEKPTDSSLRQTVTTLGYLDYYTTKPVPFPSNFVEDKEPKTNVRVFLNDLKTIKELQEKWELPNQQTTVKNLIELAQKAKELEEKLLDTQAKLEEFKNQQLKETDTETMENLESTISRILDEKLSQYLPQLQQNESTSTNSKATKSKPSEDDTDWESMSSEELKQNKSRGAAEEKLRRSYLAITNHNDHKARDNNGQPDTDKMLVINNQVLRQLSGCNGMLVKDWMERHKTAIDDHNNKYGLGIYHNKGRGDITEAINW
ncbi:MAG: protelomerase family protein [Cyanobacteria bacterium J06633_8]